MIDTEDLRNLADMMEWRDFPESHVKVRRAADTIDRQAALIAKFEEALRQIVAIPYTSENQMIHSWWKDASEIAENVLKGASNQ